MRIELIVKSRRRGRRALGPVPELQVARDFFYDRAVADEADDLKRSGSSRADQGVGFVHFFDQPGPRMPGPPRQLRAAVARVRLHCLHSGRRSGGRRCRGRRDAEHIYNHEQSLKTFIFNMLRVSRQKLIIIFCQLYLRAASGQSG